MSYSVGFFIEYDLNKTQFDIELSDVCCAFQKPIFPSMHGSIRAHTFIGDRFSEAKATYISKNKGLPEIISDEVFSYFFLEVVEGNNECEQALLSNDEALLHNVAKSFIEKYGNHLLFDSDRTTINSRREITDLSQEIFIQDTAFEKINYLYLSEVLSLFFDVFSELDEEKTLELRCLIEYLKAYEENLGQGNSRFVVFGLSGS